MKKFNISILALALSVGGFAQQFNLGKVFFATDSTWTISGNGIFQIWSDAVQTDSCGNKTEFHGGDEWISLFKIDCRSNPSQKGDLFSWLAISELKDELCPYPWRVPTKQDFIDLDIAFGGDGRNRYFGDVGQPLAQFVTDNYIIRWGGNYVGYCSFRGELSSQGFWGQYPSLSESEEYGIYFYVLRFYTDFPGISHAILNPQQLTGKTSGNPLRCVRDN